MNEEDKDSIRRFAYVVEHYSRKIRYELDKEDPNLFELRVAARMVDNHSGKIIDQIADLTKAERL